MRSKNSMITFFTKTLNQCSKHISMSLFFDRWPFMVLILGFKSVVSAPSYFNIDLPYSLSTSMLTLTQDSIHFAENLQPRYNKIKSIVCQLFSSIVWKGRWQEWEQLTPSQSADTSTSSRFSDFLLYRECDCAELTPRLPFAEPLRRWPLMAPPSTSGWHFPAKWSLTEWRDFSVVWKYFRI